MYGDIPVFFLILCILFLISMTNVIVYTAHKRKLCKQQKYTIKKDGYMKLYIQLLNGKGNFSVEKVDGQSPLYSTEVVTKAIFLSPGEHTLELSGKIKEEGVVNDLLPYYTNLGVLKVSVNAKQDSIATLFYDVVTKNLYIEESEEKRNGIL